MLAASLQLEPLSNVVPPAALRQLTELGLVVACMALVGAALVHECAVLEVPLEVVQVRDIAMAWAVTSISWLLRNKLATFFESLIAPSPCPMSGIP